MRTASLAATSSIYAVSLSFAVSFSEVQSVPVDSAPNIGQAEVLMRELNLAPLHSLSYTALRNFQEKHMGMLSFVTLHNLR